MPRTRVVAVIWTDGDDDGAIRAHSIGLHRRGSDGHTTSVSSRLRASCRPGRLRHHYLRRRYGVEQWSTRCSQLIDLLLQALLYRRRHVYIQSIPSFDMLASSAFHFIDNFAARSPSVTHRPDLTAEAHEQEAVCIYLSIYLVVLE